MSRHDRVWQKFAVPGLNRFSRLTPMALAVASGLAGGPAWAQEAGTAAAAAPGSRVVPTLSVSESYLRGSGTVDSGGKGEFITRVSPGLSWSSRSGRVQGSVNYVMDASLYSKRADSTEISNTLAANVRAMLIDQRAFVDVQANVGQTFISPFGQQSGNDTFQNNPNRTEYASLQVSPYLVGSLGSLADYTVRVNGAANSARNFSASNTTNWSALASLRSASGGRVGWALSAQRSDTDYQNNRSISTERVVAEANVRPLNDLLLFVTGGQERTNALDVNGRSYDSYGAGLRWAPSNRTNLAIAGEKRYFGSSHNFVFEHRTPQTVWRYTDARDSTDNAGLTAVTPRITLFDLYFAQFASTVPDPIAREALIRAQFPAQLLNQVVGGGTLLSALSVQRRQELGVAWIGRRATINLQAFALDVRPLDAAAASSPVLAQARVRQKGATASVSYRLTPQLTANASGSRQVTPDSVLRGGNSLNTLTLGLTTQLNRQTSLGLNARYADFSSNTDPYREALATATLYFRF